MCKTNTVFLFLLLIVGSRQTSAEVRFLGSADEFDCRA